MSVKGVATLAARIGAFSGEHNLGWKNISESGQERSAPRPLGDNQALLFARDLNRTYIAMKTAHKRLHQSYLDTLHCLVLASEFKDGDTGSHLKRIGQYSIMIAEKLGLSKETVEQIGWASPMHDIGKIGIPDRILMKKDKLTKSEYAVMKTHTLIGAQILDGSQSEILQIAHNIALSHHEKWNGQGYPLSLRGDVIPLEGRIVALADFFDALTSRRPYREAFPVDTVVDMVRRERGRHFDPRIVDVFLEELDKFKQQMRKNGNSA